MRSKVPGAIKVPDRTVRYLTEGENPLNAEKENSDPSLRYLLLRYRSNDSTRQRRPGPTALFYIVGNMTNLQGADEMGRRVGRVRKRLLPPEVFVLVVESDLKEKMFPGKRDSRFGDEATFIECP